MGHGDEIALVDANFPASSLGVPVIRLDAASVTRVLDAVLSVMPLDDFVPEATWRMQVVDHADHEIPIFAEFRQIIAQHAEPHVRLASLERFAFYERFVLLLVQMLPTDAKSGRQASSARPLSSPRSFGEMSAAPIKPLYLGHVRALHHQDDLGGTRGAVPADDECPAAQHTGALQCLPY